VVNRVDILTETSIDEGSLQSRYEVHNFVLGIAGLT